MRRVVSLNVGMPAVRRYGDREVFTGGLKEPVSHAMLRFDGFEGDGQADRQNHGGPEKAACVYPADHYPYWEERLGRVISPGTFSENLTVFGVLETETHIGDVFRAGEAVVQVCQPRMPCAKLAGKNGERLLTKWVAETGYTGFYMRVLSEGVVEAGESFEVVGRHPDRISIARVNDVIYDRSQDRASISHLAELPEFSAVGRNLFAERLEKMRSGS